MNHRISSPRNPNLPPRLCCPEANLIPPRTASHKFESRDLPFVPHEVIDPNFASALLPTERSFYIRTVLFNEKSKEISRVNGGNGVFPKVIHIDQCCSSSWPQPYPRSIIDQPGRLIALLFPTKSYLPPWPTLNRFTTCTTRSSFSTLVRR